MRLCKLPRSMDHRCHLSVTNIPETLLSPASPAGPSPRCWAAILECSGASLSSQHAAPTHREDAVAVVGSWDLVPSSLWAKRAQLCAVPAHSLLSTLISSLSRRSKQGCAELESC